MCDGRSRTLPNYTNCDVDYSYILYTCLASINECVIQLSFQTPETSLFAVTSCSDLGGMWVSVTHRVTESLWLVPDAQNSINGLTDKPGNVWWRGVVRVMNVLNMAGSNGIRIVCVPGVAIWGINHIEPRNSLVCYIDRFMPGLTWQKHNAPYLGLRVYVSIVEPLHNQQGYTIVGIGIEICF